MHITNLTKKQIKEAIECFDHVIGEYEGKKRILWVSPTCAFCRFMRKYDDHCPLIIATGYGCGGSEKNKINNPPKYIPKGYWNRNKRVHKGGVINLTIRAEYLYEHVQKPYEAELARRGE